MLLPEIRVYDTNKFSFNGGQAQLCIPVTGGDLERPVLMITKNLTDDILKLRKVYLKAIKELEERELIYNGR